MDHNLNRHITQKISEPPSTGRCFLRPRGNADDNQHTRPVHPQDGHGGRVTSHVHVHVHVGEAAEQLEPSHLVRPLWTTLATSSKAEQTPDDPTTPTRGMRRRGSTAPHEGSHALYSQPRNRQNPETPRMCVCR